MNSAVPHKTRVIGIASGKGGVGKTTFAANLASFYAEKGKRVLIFDADIGFANIHIALRSKLNGSVVDVLNGNKEIDEVIVTTPQGISIVSGGNGLEEALAIDESRAAHVIQAFAALESKFDIMIVDISAGGNQSVLRFLSACHHQIIIGTNEPSSVADAYALIKLLKITMDLNRMIFVPNRIKTAQEGRVLFDKMNAIAAKYLGTTLNYIGGVSDNVDYSSAWRDGNTAVLNGRSSTSYNDFNIIVENLEKLPCEPTGSSLQFFS